MTKHILCSILSAALAILLPVLPFATLCSLLVVVDYITALRLGRRVRRKYNNVLPPSLRLQSRHIGRLVGTLLKIYMALIIAQMMQDVIFEGLPTRFVNFVAGLVCIWQVVSILENEAACNDSRWARMARRILIDKAERHLGIELTEIKEDKPSDSTS